MSNVRDITEELKKVGSSLKSGDGGGTYNDMEQRVDRLESDMKEVISDLKALRADTSEIKGHLRAMPTTIQLLGFVIAIFVAAGVVRWFS